jgi:hypothetical protein
VGQEDERPGKQRGLDSVQPDAAAASDEHCKRALHGEDRRRHRRDVEAEAAAVLGRQPGTRLRLLLAAGLVADDDDLASLRPE